MDPSLILQNIYESAKDIIIAGFVFAQEYTAPILTAVQTKMMEYNINEILHSMSPDTWTSILRKLASPYKDTLFKHMLVVQNILTVVLVSLNWIPRLFPRYLLSIYSDF
jgi:hypothetical protein